MNQIGRTLLIFGLVLAAVGLIIIIAGKLNIPFGKLPGDLTYHKKGLTVFAPFSTMIIISVVLTLIFNLFSRWK